MLNIGVAMCHMDFLSTDRRRRVQANSIASAETSARRGLKVDMAAIETVVSSFDELQKAGRSIRETSSSYEVDVQKSFQTRSIVADTTLSVQHIRL